MIERLKEPDQRTGRKLEIVLKCDSAGSVEAVTAAILKVSVAEVDISVIRSGIGVVSKSDVMLAETASRLIVGFQVELSHGLDRELREGGVEVRLYDVIYELTGDIRTIAESLIPSVPQEQVIGSGKVIALFKSSRKGIIIGCEVMSGFFAQGQHFRIISAMGPIYSGTIDSLHIEEKAVQKAARGQQVGIKIKEFHEARIGDIVESFRPQPQEKKRSWQPTGKVIRKSS
jgi:translation initiation factor IF-2